ncbi:MAG: hypothetical protein PUP91_39065 [Rhizonema sp. PD37]|nr:hypothetical protein [Rhizonema sp. PD37]
MNVTNSLVLTVMQLIIYHKYKSNFLCVQVKLETKSQYLQMATMLLRGSPQPLLVETDQKAMPFWYEG